MGEKLEEKVLEPPFKTGWLKRGEKITVKNEHKFEVGHDSPPAKNMKEAIKKEVRRYLLSGDVCSEYSTCIWFKEKPYSLKIKIDKEKGIKVIYELNR